MGCLNEWLQGFQVNKVANPFGFSFSHVLSSILTSLEYHSEESSFLFCKGVFSSELGLALSCGELQGEKNEIGQKR